MALFAPLRSWINLPLSRRLLWRRAAHARRDSPVRFGRILPASSMAAVTIRSTQLAALQIEFAGIASCFRGAAGFKAFDDDSSKGRTVSPSLATLYPSLDWRIV